MAIDVHFVPTPNGHKVTIALEELALPYRIIDYDMLKGEHLTPAYRAINPNARLPAIVDHDPPGGGAPLVLWESGAILVYLAERAGRLLPTEPRRRALTMQWLMWQMAGLGPMHGQAHHFLRYAPGGNDYASDRYANEARRLLRVLDHRLGAAEYLAETYSIADIACWPWVRASQVIGLDLAELPHARRWFAAVGERPTVTAGTQIANAALLARGRVPLNPEQWSNLFGDNMLAAAGVGGMNDEAVAELAHRFLDAIANGDIDVVTGFYAENVVVWHNHDGIETTRDDAIDTLRRFVMLAPTRRYAGRRLDVFPGGFVEQHVLIAERDDGRRLELPACLIGRVAGGLITRLEEYFDPAPLMTWLTPPTDMN